MRLNKNIALPVVICVVTMLIVMGLTFYIDKTKDEVTTEAVAVNELEIYIDFPEETRKIKSWGNADGIRIFFLPSGSENYEVYFGNLGKDSQLLIDDKSVDSKTELMGLITLEETHSAEFVSDDGVKENQQIMFAKSDSVAALFLETNSGSMDSIHEDKTYREKAAITLFNSEGQQEYSDRIEYVKARGNSTFLDAQKKSYQIKLNKETEILGMPSADKWLLLANEIDYTLMKNELVFRFTEKYSTIPTIQGRYCDLYLNGEYAGNYYLCEKVEVQKNRLNITDLQEATELLNYDRDYNTAQPYVSEDGNIKAVTGLKNPEDITGGYLVEHVPSAEFEISGNAFRTDSGRCYVICSPKIATKEQAEYICRFFNEMEVAIYSPNGINPENGKHYSDYLDIDSWAMKYLIEETFSDGDAAAASAFFYKDVDKVDSHLFAGPMWDYDRSLGSYGFTGNFNLDDPERVRNLGIYAAALMAHEEVKEKVCELLEECLIPYADNLMKADIYNLRQEIGQSAHLNRMRWSKVVGYYSDYTAATEYLAEFLNKKAQFLKKVWGEGTEFCTVTFLDYYGSPSYIYTVEKGKCLESVPNLANMGFIFNGWYSEKDGLPFDRRLPVMQNEVYESRWIGIDILLANGLQMLQNTTGEYGEIESWTQIPPEALEVLADYLRQIQSGQEAGQ